MHDPWIDRLSDYLDQDLSVAESHQLEEHLVGCATCATALAELRRVIERAHALPATPPASDLWGGIVARLNEAPGALGEPDAADARVLRLAPRRAWWSRRLTMSLPQALAASLLLVALSGGAMWGVLQRGVRPSPASGSAASVPRPIGTPEPEALGPGGDDALLISMDPRYDRTVADLQHVLVTQRSHLDTSTVRILELNLTIIDRAVTDARRAVESDPSNSYLRAHLASTMKRKVDLLRRAAVIASARG